MVKGKPEWMVAGLPLEVGFPVNWKERLGVAVDLSYLLVVFLHLDLLGWLTNCDELLVVLVNLNYL